MKETVSEISSGWFPLCETLRCTLSRIPGIVVQCFRIYHKQRSSPR